MQTFESIETSFENTLKSGAKTAIITGASSGLGRLFAKEIIANYDIEAFWFLGRNMATLKESAALFEETNIKCHLIVCDLDKSTEIIERELARLKPKVQVFVNNAGFGKMGDFKDLELEDLASVVHVNCQAIVELDHYIYPYLNSGASVFHTASVAAFLPEPGFSVYAASKAFVLNYSRALHREWKKSKAIKVTVLCPGPMETKFFNASPQQLVAGVNRLGIENPEKVVKNAVKKNLRGKEVAILGWRIRLIQVLCKLLPHKFCMWVEKFVI